MRLPESLSPLRDPRFAWFFGGRFISTMGSVMAPVALTFAVLDLTDSPSALGAVLAARSIPLVLFLLVGGVVADRFSRSLVMQVSHLTSAATQGLVAVLLLTGTAELWMIIVLEALNGIVSAFTFPAMQGVVPLVVPRTPHPAGQRDARLHPQRAGRPRTHGGRAHRRDRRLGMGDRRGRAHLGGRSVLHVPGQAPTGRARPRVESSMVGDLKEGWVSFVERTWVWVVVVGFGLMNAIWAGAFFTLGPDHRQAHHRGRRLGLRAEQRGGRARRDDGWSCSSSGFATPCVQA